MLLAEDLRALGKKQGLGKLSGLWEGERTRGAVTKLRRGLQGARARDREERRRWRIGQWRRKLQADLADKRTVNFKFLRNKPFSSVQQQRAEMETCGRRSLD